MFVLTGDMTTRIVRCSHSSKTRYSSIVCIHTEMKTSSALNCQLSCYCMNTLPPSTWFSSNSPFFLMPSLLYEKNKKKKKKSNILYKWSRFCYYSNLNKSYAVGLFGVCRGLKWMTMMFWDHPALRTSQHTQGCPKIRSDATRCVKSSHSIQTAVHL